MTAQVYCAEHFRLSAIIAVWEGVPADSGDLGNGKLDNHPASRFG